MSDTSSDAESSCGWTIISNEGSDIETLGSEVALGHPAELVECLAVEAEQGQDTPASAAPCVEESITGSLVETVEEQNIDDTLYEEVRSTATRKLPVPLLSSSENSDIMTLGDCKEDERAGEEEAAVNEEFYLGTPCSSQYTFGAAETALPAQPPALNHSSSSEDEARQSGSTAVRRRRLRKNTTSVATEPDEDEEVLETEQSEEEMDEGQRQEQQDVGTGAAVRGVHGQTSSVFNMCVLVALIVAVSVGFRHFQGTVQIQQSQKCTENPRVEELVGVRELLQTHSRETDLTNEALGDISVDEQDHATVFSRFTEVIKKIEMKNRELNNQHSQIQAQRDELEVMLKQKTEEKTHILFQQQKLTAENQLLKSSLKREEKSLSALQEELRNLRSRMRDLEAVGAGTDSLLLENQRLKVQLEEEKLLIHGLRSQKDSMRSEAQTLTKKLEMEKRFSEELRMELNLLRSRTLEAEEDSGSEAAELQSRLMEMEKRLSFEQQRSDLWERLYVETKEERAKGDSEPKVKKPKAGMAGKVKETFDAVKNSTKEFVHHHKEQIKKAKAAVKENLRKFSDSVKSTFRTFKDSASTFINKAKDFYSRRGDDKEKESWQRRFHRPHRRASQKAEDFHSNHNTRKSGGKVHQEEGQHGPRSSRKGCSGVVDCAVWESRWLFNKAMDPIRADEFHQLLQSYLQQTVHHFHHWKDLENFINTFFHNGVFIHDQILFTDFVRDVVDYLSDMQQQYQGLDDDTFEDLDDYIYRHFFGEAFTKSRHPHSGPFERPEADSKESKARNHQRKQPRGRSPPHRERKWSSSGRNGDRNIADVKIELGPMPFDPKY